MILDTDFDGGALEILDASDPRAVTAALRGDTAADFLQNFCFRVSFGAAGERGRGRPRRMQRVPCEFRIVNAGEATYADAWGGYRALASYDGEHWFRVPTEFDGEALVLRHAPVRESVIYSYFAAYPEARHAALLARAARTPWARVVDLGRTVQGRPMNLIAFGDEDAADRPRIWISARQHPGESMAEWFAEGAALHLLDGCDALTRELLGRAVVYVIPRMNPDGAALGNHRTNAAGVDLNRAWFSPSPETSPEVFAVRAAMEETGVDLFLDIHGDEREAYAFAAGCEGNPDYSERIEQLEHLFVESLVAFDEFFTRRLGYAPDAPGEADLRVAANWVGERFDCLAMTLEMPFHEDPELPERIAGWSPARCRRFGRDALQSVLVCLDALR